MDILKHPLFLLFVSAVISGIFIPWFLRRRQYKQKELELKTEIVSDITEAVMKTFMTAYLFNTRRKEMQQSVGKESPQKELYKAYKEWKVQGCIIGTKLHAYFPKEEIGDEQIHKKWDRFKDALSELYERKWDIDNEKNTRELEEVKEILFDEKAKIMQEILDSKITVFQKRRKRRVETEFQGAILQEVDLRRALLLYANLRDANLSKANLQGADLRNAELQRADLWIADLKEANLNGADLRNVCNLTVEQLSNVKSLYNARLDPGLLKQIKKDYPHLLEKAKPEEEKEEKIIEPSGSQRP